MPSSRDFPNSGIEPLSVTTVALADEFFTTWRTAIHGVAMSRTRLSD